MGILLNETIKSGFQCSSRTAVDLQLDEVLSHAEIPGHLSWQAEKIEQYRTADPEIILWRQDVLSDLLANPALMDIFIELNNSMDIWTTCFERQYTPNIRDQINYLPVIGGFLDIMFRMDHLLQETSVKSQGIKELQKMISNLIKDNDLINFSGIWKQLAAGVDIPRRFGLALALDGFGNIKGMHLTEISTERHRTGEVIPWSPKFTYVAGLFRSPKLMAVHPPQMTPTGDLPEKDLPSMLYNSIRFSIDQNIEAALREAFLWLRNVTGGLLELKDDILFFTAAYSLCSYWRKKGLPFTFPTIADSDDNEFIEGLYHPSLLENDSPVVTNQWLCKQGNEIQVLTGTNQGGKTTYLQSVGIAYWLFQLGWAIPASSASIRPVENMVTIFSSSEETGSRNGRLSKELKELSGTVPDINPNTLVLFNEPFTSCTFTDSLNMSLEMICYLKLLGVKGLWVTHLHSLADQCESLNGLLDQGSKLITLEAGIEKGGDNLAYPTYKIRRVKPHHSSFARDALVRNGIGWL